MERDNRPTPDSPAPKAKPWHWRDCQIEPDWCYPTTPPADPSQGALWHDTVEQILYVWSGSQWMEIPED